MPPTRRHHESERAIDDQSRPPRSNVHRVILRVLEPSAPDPLLPTSPPLPEVQDMPPPLQPPHLQPPHLQPLHLQPPHLPPPHLPPPHLPPSHLPPPHLPPPGPPIPNDGQHGLPVNASPTYPHPYSVMFYPPAYPPVPHNHPYGASMGTAPGQPWGYTQYPAAPPLAPVLAHPLATQHATTGEDSHGHGAGPAVSGREDVARTGGCMDTNDAASSSTVGARPGRSYPNREVSNGVWEFRVEVVDGKIKHTFNAQTDMKWHDFLEEVRRHFDRPCSEIQVGYRISGETGAMSYLASEYDWNNAIAQLLGKVRSARTRAVSMEVKNMHESARARASKAHGPKGKGKHRREDDIPPEPTLDMLDHLLHLQQHLLCQEHSRPGKKTFCVVTQSGEKERGGHDEVTYEEMTLWAKHILLRKATKYTRPNVKKFDYPPTKKSRTAPTTPEVHISVNITPAPAPGSSGVEATYTASSDVPSQVLHPSVLLVLLDCIGNWSVPSLWNVLRLMDTHHPAVGPSYADLHEELVELGIEDAVDLYSLPIELLATFGWLRQDSARHLLEFCWDRFLFPLGFLEEGSIVGSVTASNSPLTNMGVSDSEEGQSIREERDDEMILEWLDGVDTDEENDEAGGGHGYRATSYEV
ncbi:hypothetical protein EDB84DRAFT_1560452 [Lactarius hengduanensis]|nr:hypothetical protein EDB84DRAFT_1560452 [Lactarius hengduanensis]